MSNMMGVL